MTRFFAAARRHRRVAALLLAVTAGALAFAGVPRGRAEAPGPVAVPNVSAASPRVDSSQGFVRVVSPAARERLIPDSSFPRGRARLLWLSGRVAQPAPRGSLVLDDAGALLEVDDRLRIRRRTLAREGHALLAVAAARDDGIRATTRAGELLHFDARGALMQRQPVHAFGFASVAATPDGAEAWLVRSAMQFAFRFDSAPPLLLRLAAAAQHPLGHAVMPPHVLLTELANAGTLAVSGDTVFYAPFIRDEVVALHANGDTIWIASRDLPQSTREPRFEIDSGRAVVDYHPVNLGAALGPDGHLYVLSTPDFTTAEGRLDVFDRTSGVLLRSARLPTALPTIAVADDGRVHLLDALQLLTGVAPEEREPLPPLTLPLLSGGTARLDSAQTAAATLVNVWASWCAPCRTEMPALDSLRRELADSGGFRFMTVNEDLRVDDARAFLAGYGFNFPVLLGRGRARDRLHYPGLPYTFLLDASGRIVQRWVGFTGPEQIDAIRAATLAELNRQAPAAHPAHHH